MSVDRGPALPIIVWPRMYGKVALQQRMQAQWDRLTNDMKTLGNASLIATEQMQKFKVSWYAKRVTPVALKAAHKHGKHRGWR